MISVGNLAVGGSGKTPLVAHIAAQLREQGHRPSILTRGYARRKFEEGVVVVRDSARILADLDRSGDEPLMLARALEGVAVLVSPDRYLAGRLAERRLGCTVHILDDGFQHVGLARDLDIVIASPGDLDEGAVLPEGRLREPIQTISEADAVVLLPGTASEAEATADRMGVRRVFASRRVIGVPRMVEPYGEAPRVPRDAPILGLAGIARPERFFEDLSTAGWHAVDSMVFPDHHRYSARDMTDISDRVRKSGAELVLTTEKDVVRLLPHRPLGVKVAWVPLTLAFDPPDRFDSWIANAL